MKGLFIDFYDSFSANLIQCFNGIDLDLEHHYWDEDKLELHGFDFVVLGPGPGFIDDYKTFNPMLNEIVDLNIKVVGFCLGHQILGSRLGHFIKKLERPFHAKTFKVYLGGDFAAFKTDLNVQFYNSWYLDLNLEVDDDIITSVATLEGTNMVVSMRTNQFISYQFHPESVGTSCPQSIFRNIKDFLYNNRNAIEN